MSFIIRIRLGMRFARMNILKCAYLILSIFLVFYATFSNDKLELQPFCREDLHNDIIKRVYIYMNVSLTQLVSNQPSSILIPTWLTDSACTAAHEFQPNICRWKNRRREYG